MTVALYAGSFDPIHLGHVSVVARGAELFDRLVVGVIGNPGKRRGLLTIDERLELVAAAIGRFSNTTSVAHHGLTVDLARRTGATVLIRTGHKERQVEWEMASTNRAVAALPTVFVAPDPALVGISSTRIRFLVGSGRAAEARRLLPPEVSDRLDARPAPDPAI